MEIADRRGSTPRDEPYVARFGRILAQQQTRCAPVINLSRRRAPSILLERFPFASLSVFVVLIGMLMVSMHLGGWTWSSWIYAFSLGITVPLIVIEIKRRAVITGAAVLLLSATVLIAAGLPQYFGYSTSALSWYDLTAHYLAALALTVLMWSVLCWVKADGDGIAKPRVALLCIVAVMLTASISFELLEYSTDKLLGWTNFHAGIDTAGDIIFDVAGVVTAALVTARHRVMVIKRPFWHIDVLPT